MIDLKDKNTSLCVKFPFEDSVTGRIYCDPKPGSQKVIWFESQEDASNRKNARITERSEAEKVYWSLQQPPNPTVLSPAAIISQIVADADCLVDSPPTPPLTNEITATALLNRQVEAIECLIEPIFQRVGLAAIAGSSDVGKSAFLRQLAFAVSTGQSQFLGWKIRSKHQSSIYVSSEDDENATAFLLHSLNKSQQHDPNDCAGLRFVFDTYDLINELDKRLTNTPADLVIIDAFGDLYTGDANKTNQIRQFLHEYSQLAQKHGCLILWLHHTGKRTDDDPPSKHHVIGGQGFEGKMRLLIELRRDHHDKTHRHFCIVKGNYLSDEYKTDSYVLKFENFQFSQTGERVPFEQLAKPKDQLVDGGLQKYQQIQEARRRGYKGEALAKELGWSKGYISQIERKYSDGDKDEFIESLSD